MTEAKEALYVITPLMAVRVAEGEELPPNPLDTPEWKKTWFMVAPFGWEAARLQVVPLGRSAFTKGAWVYEMRATFEGKRPIEEGLTQHPSTGTLAKELRRLGWTVWAQPLMVVDGLGKLLLRHPGTPSGTGVWGLYLRSWDFANNTRPHPASQGHREGSEGR